MCGATGYVGDIPGGQSMAVWTSDDDGVTYTLSKGKGAWPASPGYPTGNVTMPFKRYAGDLMYAPCVWYACNVLTYYPLTVSYLNLLFRSVAEC